MTDTFQFKSCIVDCYDTFHQRANLSYSSMLNIKSTWTDFQAGVGARRTQTEASAKAEKKRSPWNRQTEGDSFLSCSSCSGVRKVHAHFPSLQLLGNVLAAKDGNTGWVWALVAHMSTAFHQTNSCRAASLQPTQRPVWHTFLDRRKCLQQQQRRRISRGRPVEPGLFRLGTSL